MIMFDINLWFNQLSIIFAKLYLYFTMMFYQKL